MVSNENGPKRIREVLGQEIGILNNNSITGHNLVTHLLSKEGIVIGNDKTPFVSKDNSYDMLKAFASGEINTMIGWSSLTGDPSAGYSRGNLKQLSEQYGISPRNLSVIWKSKQIPHRPHIIRKKINGEAKQILRNTLLELNEKNTAAYDAIEPVYSGGFVAGRHDRMYKKKQRNKLFRCNNSI
jgi:ABC-type phosphate/phosphonate transport system substrate-binding protein